MKRKLLSVLLTAVMTLSCTFALAACNDAPIADSGDPVVTPDDDSDTPGGNEQHEHTYTSVVTTQPTCTQEGVMTYTCTCGDSYTQAIPTIAHSYVNGVCIMCSEHEPTEGLVFTLSGNGTEYAVTDYTSVATEVYIPATYEGLPVTGIGYGAFMDCRYLTSITIPDSVTSIGASAFMDCQNLTSITIPSSVTSIGGNTFYGCSSLTSIMIPQGVTSIEIRAFSSCSSLTSITIPDSVVSIGTDAFSGCSGLQAVYISDMEAWCNIQIGYGNANPLMYAHDLYLDGELVTDLVVPENVTNIGWGAFNGCSSLTSVAIPDSVTSIGQYAFQDCINLTCINIPDSVTSIGDCAFWSCSNLDCLIIGKSVTSIGERTFYNCSSLASITVANNNPVYHSVGNCIIETESKTLILSGCKNSVIPTDGSISSIGEYAFTNCSELTSITIPECVTRIGEWAFGGCSNLVSVIFEDTEGWYVTYAGGRTISIASHRLSDHTTAANLITDTYYFYYWYKE